MFTPLAIPDVFLFTPRRFADARGFFVETFNQARLEPMTGPLSWVQDNQARSTSAGTLRGLHFQIPPLAQDKLIRCISGSILDVAVDIRQGSPTYGRHVSAVLTAEGGEQLFVPKGFAHGYLTREAGCEIAYKVTNYYSPAHEHGLQWNDPALGIDWGIAPEAVILSEKDQTLPTLAERPAYFVMGG